ncbi:MAG: Gfo/Idh/MocA family oxidoreductase [Lachnospiraceae bacterium]|nr:Gfo/Idh/MocA family oxidoreductase [Lachnospiraceae bacterium]
MYKIAFCGIGSIGKRHLRNTALYLESQKKDFVVDVIRTEKNVVTDDEISGYIHEIYSYDDEIANDYDIIFVTNPTGKHYETVKQYLKNTVNMFIEKPVFDSFEYDIESLNLNANGIYYVACPLRYTNVIQYIRKNINTQSAISIRAICSSYLPEWRAGIDYRDTYSAKKDMGGGVAIDLIHEWDYLTYLFGFPEEVTYLGGKYSDLEIDSDDLAVYIGKAKDKLIELHLDYFGRKNVREMEIFLPDETVKADLINGTVTYLKCGEIVNLKEERNDYQMQEIIHFFAMLDGKCKNDNDVYNAVKTLKLTRGIV